MFRGFYSLGFEFKTRQNQLSFSSLYFAEIRARETERIGYVALLILSALSPSLSKINFPLHLSPVSLCFIVSTFSESGCLLINDQWHLFAITCHTSKIYHVGRGFASENVSLVIIWSPNSAISDVCVRIMREIFLISVKENSWIMFHFVQDYRHLL